MLWLRGVHRKLLGNLSTKNGSMSKYFRDQGMHFVKKKLCSMVLEGFDVKTPKQSSVELQCQMLYQDLEVMRQRPLCFNETCSLVFDGNTVEAYQHEYAQKRFVVPISWRSEVVSRVIFLRDYTITSDVYYSWLGLRGGCKYCVACTSCHYVYEMTYRSGVEEQDLKIVQILRDNGMCTSCLPVRRMQEKDLNTYRMFMCNMFSSLGVEKVTDVYRQFMVDSRNPCEICVSCYGRVRRPDVYRFADDRHDHAAGRLYVKSFFKCKVCEPELRPRSSKQIVVLMKENLKIISPNDPTACNYQKVDMDVLQRYEQYRLEVSRNDLEVTSKLSYALWGKNRCDFDSFSEVHRDALMKVYYNFATEVIGVAKDAEGGRSLLFPKFMIGYSEKTQRWLIVKMKGELADGTLLLDSFDDGSLTLNKAMEYYYFKAYNLESIYDVIKVMKCWDFVRLGWEDPPDEFLGEMKNLIQRFPNPVLDKALSMLELLKYSGVV